jgi:methionyl-tRNA formyltransferase
MIETQHNLNRPIRVVVFCGGPTLERGVKLLVCRLEEHPEIEFLGAFCQSKSQTFWAVLRDLWRRRRFIALPLILMKTGETIGRYLIHPLAEIELKRGIACLTDKIHYISNIHAEDVLTRVRSLSPDLGLIYGSPVLKPVLFEIPSLGTLGIHHGKMPEYRGLKTTFWEIFNDEKTAGVTIQKVNAGLDTGMLAKQGKVTIGSHSPLAVEKKLELVGLELYIKAIVEVKNGIAQYQQWQGEKGKLYKDPKIMEILGLWWRQFKRSLIGFT